MRMKFLLLPSLLLLAVFSFGQETDSTASRQDLSTINGQHEPPMLGIHWARGFEAFSRAARGSNPNMTYHGGVIMPSTVSEAIFWGPSWSNSSFVGDKITGLDSWYSGFSNSNYAKTSDEYTGSNGQVGPSVTHNGHLVDTSTASNGSSTSAIVAEACKEITNPVLDGYYPVYVDIKRGNAGYCAYHTFGSCKGVTVQVAFSSTWMAMGAAIRQTLQGCTRRGWRPWRMSADTNSRRRARTRILRGRGMTNAARRTAINARGPSMFRWLRSATTPSGRFRGNGRTTRSIREQVTRTARGRGDASTATESYRNGNCGPNHLVSRRWIQ